MFIDESCNLVIFWPTITNASHNIIIISLLLLSFIFYDLSFDLRRRLSLSFVTLVATGDHHYYMICDYFNDYYMIASMMVTHNHRYNHIWYHISIYRMCVSRWHRMAMAYDTYTICCIYDAYIVTTVITCLCQSCYCQLTCTIPWCMYEGQSSISFSVIFYLLFSMGVIMLACSSTMPRHRSTFTITSSTSSNNRQQRCYHHRFSNRTSKHLSSRTINACRHAAITPYHS